jgi:hypothetical protein
MYGNPRAKHSGPRRQVPGRKVVGPPLPSSQAMMCVLVWYVLGLGPENSWNCFRQNGSKGISLAHVFVLIVDTPDKTISLSGPGILQAGVWAGLRCCNPVVAKAPIAWMRRLIEGFCFFVGSLAGHGCNLRVPWGPDPELPLRRDSARPCIRPFSDRRSAALPTRSSALQILLREYNPSQRGRRRPALPCRRSLPRTC